MAGSNAPVEIASAIQSASINRHPSPRRDFNPSTAASQKQPVTIACSPAESNVAEDEIPLSILRPMPRRATMPPLPDLRFEQSYLKSIEGAKSWKGVLWITFRDQVCSLSFSVVYKSTQNLHYFSNLTRFLAITNPTFFPSGSACSNARCHLDPPTLWLAILESLLAI